MWRIGGQGAQELRRGSALVSCPTADPRCSADTSKVDKVTDLTSAAFDLWLEQYASAWEKRDGEAAAALFAENAEYYWTPFDEPKRGRTAIADAWREATARQSRVQVECHVLAVAGRLGIGRWATAYVRVGSGEHVRLDGVLTADLDDSGRCVVFREWWHTTEGNK
jgi:ketosteroid isomerase-like protein